jgi:hypothetical protein
MMVKTSSAVRGLDIHFILVISKRAHKSRNRFALNGVVMEPLNGVQDAHKLFLSLETGVSIIDFGQQGPKPSKRFFELFYRTR